MTFILLSSVRDDQSATRSFQEFRDRDELAKRVINVFEDYLRCHDADVINRGAGTEMVIVEIDEKGQEKKTLQYTSENLFAFIDDFFGEMVCLAKEGNDPLFVPYSVSYIKEAIYLYFRGQADMQAKFQLDPDSECPTMMETLDHEFSENVPMVVS